MSVKVHSLSRVETAAGVLESGRVVNGSRDCLFEREIPRNQLHAEPFILETGLSAGLESLTRLRSVAARMGHTAVAVAHTHHERRSPIRANAEDIEMVVDALTERDQKAHFVGLSRGWPDTVLALQHLPGKAESATAVAPAMMDRVHPERFVLLLAEAVIECVHHPQEFPKVLEESVHISFKRLFETVSEAVHVTLGTIHDRVEDLKRSENPPRLHMFASIRDGFFMPSRLATIANELGFDSYETYADGMAGHGALAVHQKLAQRVVEVAAAKSPSTTLQ